MAIKSPETSIYGHITQLLRGSACVLTYCYANIITSPEHLHTCAHTQKKREARTHYSNNLLQPTSTKVLRNLFQV